MHCTENLIFGFPEMKMCDLVPNSKLVDRTLLFCFGNNQATQFHLWEHTNLKQTFIWDSYLPFICIVIVASTLCVIDTDPFKNCRDFFSSK